MTSLRQLFTRHVAQTSDQALMLDVKNAQGVYIFDQNDKEYLDLNSGISVSALGHRHPEVVKKTKDQLDCYAHTMVYGEHLQSPQIKYAHLLCTHLDASLHQVYFVNSGSEAVEVAMKLAKRATGRYEILACKNAYHGSTQGAETLRSDQDFTRAFLPGIPGVRHIAFNDEAALKKINSQTAAIILEPVQGEIGVNRPIHDYLKKVRDRCNETGTLMILDEIQTGFGRTGSLFAHQHFGVVPDVLLIAKSMGGGLPIGACVSSNELLSSFTQNPTLGHITTFGGNPVCCASALGTLEVLLRENYISKVQKKEELIHKLLVHPIIKEVRSAGLLMAVELTKRKYLKHVVSKAFELGALVDYFLFNDRSFRLCPPLIITEEEIKKGLAILLKAMDYAQNIYEKK